MKTHIDIDIDDNKLIIQELGCMQEEYEISDTWPTCIKEICQCLENYLD